MLSRLIYRPRRTVLAKRNPSLLAGIEALQEVGFGAALTSDAEAVNFVVPERLSCCQIFNCAFGYPYSAFSHHPYLCFQLQRSYSAMQNE